MRLVVTEAVKQRGKIKFFNSRNGFGFIKPEDGTRDVFLSLNSLPKGCHFLLPDTAVEYVAMEGKKGPYAKEIRVLG